MNSRETKAAQRKGRRFSNDGMIEETRKKYGKVARRLPQLAVGFTLLGHRVVTAGAEGVTTAEATQA